MGGGSTATGCPHSPQNFLPGSIGLPQLLQFIVVFSSSRYCLAPQLVQNFWPGLRATPQTLQALEADEIGSGALTTMLGSGLLHIRQWV